MHVEPFNPDPRNHQIDTITLEADFLQKKSTTNEPYNSDQMALKFQEQFSRHIYSKGQPLVFKFLDKKTLALTVKKIDG